MIIISARPVKAPTARGAELIDRAPLDEVLVGWEEVDDPVWEVNPLLELELTLFLELVPVDEETSLELLQVELLEVVVGRHSRVIRKP